MKRVVVAMTAVVGLAGAVPRAAGAGEGFSGTVEAPRGPVGFTLSIEEVTSDDVTLALAQRILQSGQAGAIVDLKPLAAGRLAFETGMSYTANVVRSRQTDQGRLVVAVTDRVLRLHEESPGAAVTGMGYLELLLDESGRGGGRLVQASEIVFGEDGYLEARSLGWPELKVVDVAPTGSE